MAINARKVPAGGGNKKKFPVVEPGTYPARVVQVIDLGLQTQMPYQGQEKPPAHELMLTYELVDEFLQDEDGNDMEDKPRWQSETFPLRNLDADLAKSTKRYYALDPEEIHEGDFVALVGTPCMVTLVHKPNKKDPEFPYVNVGNVSTMRAKEAKNCPELVNPSKVFDLDAPDMEIFFSLPDWLQEKIKGNLNFEGSILEKAIAEYKGKPEEKEEKPKKAAKAKPEPEEVEEEVEDSEEDW